MTERRAYSSPKRDANAARTRARIVVAASDLFARHGYAATTLKAVAAQAGVSIQSVHLAGSKAGLLIAAFETSFAGDEGRQPLAERPDVAAMMADPDTRGTLRRYSGFIAAANARTAGLFRAMRTAAEIDADAAVALADLEQRRRADMRIAAGWLVARGLVPQSEAASVGDELGLLTAPETFLYFVDDAGWDAADYARWLERAILRLGS